VAKTVNSESATFLLKPRSMIGRDIGKQDEMMERESCSWKEIFVEDGGRQAISFRQVNPQA
jgi:hypothetical protein